MPRIYHPIDKWEEVKAGMWSEVENRKEMLEKAIAFTGNHKMYGHYMIKVIVEWPYSCENALTDKLLNQKAWVGHAACAMAIGCPEDITRQAWGYLTDEQRFLANKEAEQAIRVWRHAYSKDKQIHRSMGEEMLPGWDT